MKRFRLSAAALLVAGLGAGLAGCINPPNYPVEPSIEFSRLDVKRYQDAPRVNVRDTVLLGVNFRDGDGDLGLASTENSPPYQERNADGSFNRNRNNIFVQPYRLNPTTQQYEVVGIPGTYDGRYPRLSPSDAKPAPLKGELRFKQAFIFGQPFRSGDQVRFEVSIMDRALHESNKITTPTITIQ